MGVLNVTPDSFSDGGAYRTFGAAVAHALAMVEAGAEIVDVGPESTRPGAAGVPAEEQIARAVPVIEALRRSDESIVISIDTRLAPVARAALDAGADMINDVSALRDDPGMVELAARTGVPVCLLHRWGTSATMQVGGGPDYVDVVGEISEFLRERITFALSRGVNPDGIIADPGIGFGKRVEHNLQILRALDRFRALGRPVLVGASRKRFLGEVLGIDEPRRRDAASLACATIAAMAGAAIIRTHQVRPTVEAVQLCAAVKRAVPVDT